MNLTIFDIILIIKFLMIFSILFALFCYYIHFDLQLIYKVVFLICFIIFCLVDTLIITPAIFNAGEEFLLAMINIYEEDFKTLYNIYGLNKNNCFIFFQYFMVIRFEFMNKKLELFILYIFKLLYFKIRKILKRF
jgi:hypothetical protein